ncbi:MAG: PKD domain-containing protein, partial [Thermoplasmata archaeon]
EDVPSVLDGSSSTDPGGIALYEWNITASGQDIDVATTVPFLTFAFDRSARYDIKLTVTDHEGSTDDVEWVVEMDDVITIPPTVTWEAPSLVMEGDMFTVRAWASDPFPDDPDLVEDRLFDYTWSMGDGSAVRRGDTVTHSYAKAAATPYEVMLTVIDEDNDRVTVMVANISVLNPAPDISPVSPITVKAGKEGQTTVEAFDGTTAPGQLAFTLDPIAPEWASLTGNTLKVAPGKGVKGATYMIAVTVTDELGAATTTQVPVVVTQDEVESGIGMGTLLGVMALFLVLAVVLAVIITTRMGGGTRASEKGIPPSEKEYDDLYGEEPRRRKVRAVAKVDSEHVEVEHPAETPEPASVAAVPDYKAAAAAAGYTVEEEEGPEDEPPLPSWMSSTKAEEVHLEEKVVDAPPATPPEWAAPSQPAEEQAYKFRRPPEGDQPLYKGVGRPRM